MDDAVKIDWESEDTHFLLNPRLAQTETERLLSFQPIGNAFKGHIWLTTSGSRSAPKWVGLSKKAILSSAEAVNVHLQSDQSDCWLNPLPSFHVGGLGIFARAYLAQCHVISLSDFASKWDPFTFCQLIERNQVTLTALVPAQVFDLVASHLRAPPTLRHVIVGGGRLEPTLYHQALNLGWKLLPSYGLTECASQVATAHPSLNSTQLIPLKHVEVGTEQGLIKVRSPSLLTAYGRLGSNGWEYVDPKIDGWFLTEDRGVLHSKFLQVIGREGDFVKIGGESVSFQNLEQIFESLKLKSSINQDVVLFLKPDERLGHTVCLAITGVKNQKIEQILHDYHEQVAPFERVRSVFCMDKIPRSPLNKVLLQELLDRITMM